MATPAIKTKFQLDGEKEYKQALSEINSGLRVLNSEMKLTSAQFGDNADSVEALTSKNDVLNRQISTQKEKIETLKTALQQAAQKYGEADTKTNGYKVSLNNAEKELIDFEKQLKDNNELLAKNKTALDKSEDSTKKFGSTNKVTGSESKGLGSIIDGLAGKFGVNLPQGVTNSLDSFVSLSGKTAVLAAGFAAVVTAIAEIEKKLVSLTTAQASAADEIITLSYQTGLATDTIQELRYAAELIDVPFETLQGSMSKMVRTMDDARNGSAEAQEAFNKLGVSVVDSNGELRDSEDVLFDTIDALHRMQNATERDALAMNIFGRSAQELNPLIVQGSGVLKQYMQEAQDMGYVLSNDALSSLGAVDDALQRMKNSQTAAKNQIALEFAPALEKFYTMTEKGTKKFGEVARDSGLVNFFASILEIITALEPALETIGDILVLLGPEIKTISLVLAMIADALSVIFNLIAMITGVFTGDAGDHWNNLTDLLSGRDGATSRMWNSFFNASGNDNWQGGVTWVGENGPEKVYLPQGTQIQTAQESRMSGGDTFVITVDATNIKELNDLVRIAQDARRMSRMGYAGG